MKWSDIVSSGITVEEQIDMSHESQKVETHMYLSSLNNQETIIKVNHRNFPIYFLYSESSSNGNKEIIQSSYRKRKVPQIKSKKYTTKPRKKCVEIRNERNQSCKL